MKYLLLLLLLGLVFFMLGFKRARPKVDRPAPPAPAPLPLNIVSCAQCGLHLPQGEALPGRGGVFCTAAHRAAFEAAHGDAA